MFQRSLEAYQPANPGVVLGVCVVSERLAEQVIEGVLRVFGSLWDIDTQTAQSRGADGDQQPGHGVNPGSKVIEPLLDDISSR
jgi:hypothetical protein